MKCPKRKGATSVKDSRDFKYQNVDTTRRRRRCGKCGHRYSTVEIVWAPMVKAVGLPKYAPVAGYKGEGKDLPVHSPRRDEYARRKLARTEDSRQQSSFVDADFENMTDEELEGLVLDGRITIDDGL